MQIEVRAWTGNAKEKKRTLHRFDAVLPDASGLLPCPFCGGRAELTHTWTAHYWIECQDCEAEVPGQFSGKEHREADHRRAAESAIDAWNQRA